MAALKRDDMSLQLAGLAQWHRWPNGFYGWRVNTVGTRGVLVPELERRGFHRVERSPIFAMFPTGYSESPNEP